MVRQFEVVMKEDKRLKNIICNKCGKEIEVAPFNYKLREFHQIKIVSNQIGIIDFDLCENCLMDFIKTFEYKIKPEAGFGLNSNNLDKLSDVLDLSEVNLKKLYKNVRMKQILESKINKGDLDE